MRRDEGDYEEEMPLQQAPVPLAFQQAAKHLRAQRNVGLCTNQSQFTALIFQGEELLETEQYSKANSFKQTTVDAFFNRIVGVQKCKSDINNTMMNTIHY